MSALRTNRLKRRTPLRRGRRLRAKPDPRWVTVRAAVFKADQGRCQVPWCRAPARDVHHIVKRSQAPRLKYDPANLVSLCRACHAQTDAPYVRGRLVLTPLGDKRVLYQVITAPDKAGARGLMALYLSAGGR